jgi:crotonobetainyl-CoA:carnitine CoA-transferase CaiB-like acyl-CoA transferase
MVRGYADWRSSDQPRPSAAVPIGHDTRTVLEEAGIATDDVDRLIARGAAIG